MKFKVNIEFIYEIDESTLKDYCVDSFDDVAKLDEITFKEDPNVVADMLWSDTIKDYKVEVKKVNFD